MIRIPTAWLAPAALVLATAPALAQDAEVAADTIVASVNDTDITAGHLLLMRTQLPQEYQQIPLDQLYDALVQQAISQALLSQTLEDAPESARLTIENEERAIRANVMLQRIAEGVDTSEDALRAAYEAEYGDVDPAQEYNAAHILVTTEDEANAMIAELDEGADFAELAREHSIGPSGPNGGSLGWFGPGMMVPDFEAAVAALEPGQVSDPVQTQFGWHVIRLNDVREDAPPTFEEARESLVQDLQRAAVEARLRELHDANDVMSLPRAEIPVDFLNDPSLLDE